MSRLESEYFMSDLWSLYELRISDELFNLKVVADINVTSSLLTNMMSAVHSQATEQTLVKGVAEE